MENQEKAEMSFIDHLEELRWVLVRSIVAMILGAIVIFTKMDFFFGEVVMGPAKKDFITYKILCNLSHRAGLGDAMCMEEINLRLQSTQMSSQFMMSFTIAFVGGFILVFPYVFWQFWKFIRPALHANELSQTKGVIFWISLLFLIGIGFGYFLISPYTINFFASYSLSDIIENKFLISDYIDTMVQLVLGTGLVFQLPLAVYFFSKIGIITPNFLRTYRKYALVTILVLAAVITPPDLLSQLIIFIPLWVLYEISITISSRVQKNRAKKELKEWS